jgi:hypothetical protein
MAWAERRSSAVAWWHWLIVLGGVLFVGWGAIFWIMERRAGTNNLHYSDGCAKPIVETSMRSDGSRKNIIPRPGDGEVEDLEHLLEHRKAVSD